MDFHIAKWVFETFGQNEIVVNIAKIFTYLGNKWVLVALCLALLCFKKTRKISIFMIIICGGVWVLNDFIVKPILQRDRPFVDNPEWTAMMELAKMKLPDGFSLASGHAAVSMAFVTTIYMFDHKKGLIASIYAIMVGASRIFLGAHYFSDVLMGFALGIICAIIGFYVLEYIWKHLIEKKITIVFASNNVHKLDEVRQILKNCEVLSMKDIGFDADIEENGKTLADNAKIKAQAIRDYCKEKNIDYPVFSDDSGLFVNALKGAPGVKSARYAKSHDDEANRQKLIKNLSKKEDKSAYFECVICFIDGEDEQIFSGKTFGKIIDEYRGDTSFGYDCIFISDDLNKTFGEAGKDEKDAVSHRGRAVLLLDEYLKNRKKKER